MGKHVLNGQIKLIEPKGKGLKGEELFAIHVSYDDSIITLIANKEFVLELLKETCGIEKTENILKVANTHMKGMMTTMLFRPFGER